MNQLTIDQYTDTLKLFGDMSHHLSIQGVLTGAIPGQAWANRNSTCALVESPQGYLFGGQPDGTFLDEFKDLLQDELLPKRAKTGELDYVVFFPQGWLEPVQKALESLSPMADTRMTWQRDLQAVSPSLPDCAVPVTLELLHRQDLKGVGWTCDEILEGWPTIEEFCEKGFGCVAIAAEPEGERIIGWSLTDWVVGDRCEIGIEVAQEYRLQGYGKRLAQGTLALAARRGMAHAGWQCWASNTGSQGVARSVGFHLHSEFPVLFGWNHPLNNSLINGNYYLNDHPSVGVLRDYRRSADAYAHALDQGWDWGGSPILYYNTAVLYYKTSEPARARHYFELALQKGFAGIEAKRGTWEWQYTYHEADAEGIIQILSGNGKSPL